LLGKLKTAIQFRVPDGGSFAHEYPAKYNYPEQVSGCFFAFFLLLFSVMGTSRGTRHRIPAFSFKSITLFDLIDYNLI